MRTAWSEGIVAEARTGSFLGVQFHPEKSGAAGRALSRPRARGGEGAIPLPRLIPCLDVAAGRVVKGVRFQGLRDVGDPVELGAAYSDRGADELVFLDVKATLEERDTLVGVVRRVAEQLAIPFTVGGGIRSVADADSLLSAGADKISVNSAALASPSLITALAEKLGSQAVVVAIDTEDGRVKTRAGTTETPRGHGRVGDRGRAARGGGDPAHLDRLRRDAGGLRPRDHQRGGRAPCRCR